MKLFYTSLKYIAVLALSAVVAGCSTPASVAITKAYNLGQELPADMVKSHQAAMVGFDEKWVGDYNYAARNSLYVQGVEKGTTEYNMRTARVNLAISGKGVLWVSEGELLHTGGAYVPDQLPQLHAGDIVEVRQTGTWDTMKDFAKKGEGNIVVRIICRKGEPSYDKCFEDAPRINKTKGVGRTNTPYPESVRDYGYTFTPMYDDKGQALRPYPQEATSAAH
jgi:hypothetical protein